MFWIEERKTTAGKRFYVVRSIKGKKLYKAAGKTYSAAVKLRREMEDRALLTHINPLGVDLTLAALQNSYLEHSQSKRPGTIKSIQYATDKLIGYFGATTKVREISRHNIEQFKQALLSRGHNFSGANIILSHVIAMFQYAIEMEWISRNSAKGSKTRVESGGDHPISQFFERPIDFILNLFCR